MANTIYNDISSALKTLILNDSEFADIISANAYLNTMTLEDVAFPCMFVAKTERETVMSELAEGRTEDALTYLVEVYYKADTGNEVNCNKKDHALKALVKAAPTISGNAADSQCYSSRISSTVLQNKIITGLEAKVAVWLVE